MDVVLLQFVCCESPYRLLTGGMWHCKHRFRSHNENNLLERINNKIEWWNLGYIWQYFQVCMMPHERDIIIKRKKKSKKREASARLQLNKWKTARSNCLSVCSHPNSAMYVGLFIVCITRVGILLVHIFPPTPLPTRRACLCVQTCALISFYWNCCVTCWILMWDDLFLPLSSRCKRRYPTCFKTPPCDELEDQQEGTVYYLAVAHKGNLSHV